MVILSNQPFTSINTNMEELVATKIDCYITCASAKKLQFTQCNQKSLNCRYTNRCFDRAGFFLTPLSLIRPLLIKNISEYKTKSCTGTGEERKVQNKNNEWNHRFYSVRLKRLSLNFFHFSSHALRHLAGQPVRVISFINGLRCWFYTLDQPKSRWHELSKASDVGLTTTSRATDANRQP